MRASSTPPLHPRIKQKIPKYAVSEVVGFLKGKSAIWIANELVARSKKTGKHFWTRGYFVSTVGADERTVREYIRRQDEEDRRLDQLRLP